MYYENMIYKPIEANLMTASGRRQFLYKVAYLDRVMCAHALDPSLSGVQTRSPSRHHRPSLSGAHFSFALFGIPHCRGFLKILTASFPQM